MTDEEPKQWILVRRDLNMRKGKLAAQVAHASMAVVLDFLYSRGCFDRFVIQSHGKFVKQWLDTHFTKVVLWVQDEEELLNMHSEAVNRLLPCSLIKDRGLTEFGGVPTYTTAAIGPTMPSKLSGLVAHLKLV